MWVCVFETVPTLGKALFSLIFSESWEKERGSLRVSLGNYAFEILHLQPLIYKGVLFKPQKKALSLFFRAEVLLVRELTWCTLLQSVWEIAILVWYFRNRIAEIEVRRSMRSTVAKSITFSVVTSLINDISRYKAETVSSEYMFIIFSRLSMNITRPIEYFSHSTCTHQSRYL